ncbi:MAG: UPF0175 family protein [Verrucomicrobiota bacterium]
MEVTLSLPDEIVAAIPRDGTRLDRRVMEALVLDLFRDRVISGGKVAELLKISRQEADQLLIEHGLMESPTLEEIGEDSRRLEKILRR